MAVVRTSVVLDSGGSGNTYSWSGGTVSDAPVLQVVLMCGAGPGTHSEPTDSTGGFTTMGFTTHSPWVSGSSNNGWWWWGYRVVAVGDSSAGTITLPGMPNYTNAHCVMASYTGFVEAPTPLAAPTAVTATTSGSVTLYETATAECVPQMMVLSPGAGGVTAGASTQPPLNASSTNLSSYMESPGPISLSSTLGVSGFSFGYAMYAVRAAPDPSTSGWSIGTLRFGGGSGWH